MELRLSRKSHFQLLQLRKPLWAGAIAVLLVLVALDAPLATPLRAASPSQADAPSSQLAPTTNPKRIAVLDFDDSMVQNDVEGVFGLKVDVGKGFAGLLVCQLTKDGSYSVVDPKTVDKLLDERKFSKSDRTDRESAVRIGKILGVDGIVIGNVTRFGGSTRKIMPDEAVHKRAAIVEAEARLVNIPTDEIVAVASGRGESQKGFSLLAGWRGSSDGNVDFGSSDFQRTLMGQALNAAVTQIAAQLAGDSPRLTTIKQ